MPEIQGKLELRPLASAGMWEELCRQHQGATAFHQWSWLDTMATAFGSRFLPLGVYRDNALVGLSPLLVKQRGPYRHGNLVPFPYLGPLIPRELLADALRLLDEYQRRLRLGIIRFCFAPGADVDTEQLVEDGFAVYGDATMIVPLDGRSEEQLWAGMRERGRRNVRRAMATGVTVEPASEREIKQALPDSMQEIFARRGWSWDYPPVAAELVWDRYHEDPDVHMATAHYEGEPAAIFVTLVAGARAFTWMTCGCSRYRQTNATSLLYWDAISWARARGCAAIDLVGTVDKGIAQFKANFGALEVPYLVAERRNARWVKWAQETRGEARELLRRLARRSGALQSRARERAASQ